MAVNERSFIRIVPESTGDRIGFYHTWDIEYTGKTGAFNIGDIVIGSSSGTQALVINDKVDNDLSTSGVVSTILLEGFESGVHTTGETLDVLGVPQATVSTAYCIYVNTSTLVGGNNPNYKQSIDSIGQAYVRFAEGAPQFDAFGKLQVSSATTIGEHVLTYDLHSEDFTDTLVGGGALTHQPNHSGALFSCGTLSGDQVERITNKYYKYQSGKSQLIEITCAVGDTGKADVTRTWGYGDSDDGVFFLLEGTTFNAYIRNSSSGSVTEIKIPQNLWSRDRMDGSHNSRNLSGHNLDVSKDNIYWIDLQWLGAGLVRFGLVIEGRRIVCHEEYHANLNNLPYIRTGSLPLYAEQINTGIPASGSEFRVWCMVVKTEGSYEPPLKHFSGNITGLTVTTSACISSFRSKQTFKTLDNRIIAYADEIKLFTSTEPVLIEVIKNGTLGGTPTWGNDPSSDSSVEFDTGATTVTDGTVIESTIVGTGTPAPVKLNHIFSPDGEGMSRKADITADPDIYSIKVTRLSGTTTDVTMTTNWNEAQ